MIYDYLLTVYNLIIGLISGKVLVNIAICAIAIYIVWEVLALVFSFATKFVRKTGELTKFVRSSNGSPDDLNRVINSSKQVSQGLYMGLKRFRNNGGYASDYLSKQEALDSDFDGGVFNHGKSLMKAYILFCTGFIFMLNLGYLSSSETLTGEIFAQSLVLPLVFYFFMKIFYFIYTSIHQQLYKLGEENFYELVDALDIKFGSEKVVRTVVQEETSEDVSAEDELAQEAQEEQNEEQPKEETENSEEQEENSKENEEEHKKTLDDYDFFKKKNIDVDKLAGEVPVSSNLPYIDVDSDYVIKDDENAANSYHPNAKTGSEVLGGMMHNLSQTKKNSEESNAENSADENIISTLGVAKKNKKEDDDVFGKLEEINEEKANESDDILTQNDEKGNNDPPVKTNAVNPENKISDTPAFDVSSFKIKDNTEDTETETAVVQSGQNEDTNIETQDTNEEIEETDENVAKEENIEKDEQAQEIGSANNYKSKYAKKLTTIEINKNEEEIVPNNYMTTKNVGEKKYLVVERNENEHNPYETQESEEHIANIVGKFKTRSKLATGGIEIERNDGAGNSLSAEKKVRIKPQVQVLDTNVNEGGVINSMRNTQTFGENDEENETGVAEIPTAYAKQEYEEPQTQRINTFQVNRNVDYSPPQNLNQNYNQNVNFNNQFEQNYYGENMDGRFMDFGGENQENFDYEPNVGFNSNISQDVNQFGGGVTNQTTKKPAEIQTRKVEMNKPVSLGQTRTTTKNSKVVQANPEKTKKVVQKEPEEMINQIKTAKSKDVVKTTKPEPQTPATQAKRGRPAKQVFDDTVTIKDDKEFEQVLSRAEKLMRKSEEGLSQSQSKRVEKELKTLLDALSKYKEKK